MFGLNPKSLHEIEEMLAQPNCTVDDLLKCTSVTSQFRNGNKKLIDFLLIEKNSMRIFEIIKNEPNRAIQKSILGLFQTSNTALHRLLADNINIAEYAISTLESTSSHAVFSIGIMSRILSRAFDLWPEDMSEIFRISNTIYQTIIKHIDNECVFRTIQDLVTESHKGMWLLMWHLFRFLVGKDAAKYTLKHRKALIDNDLIVDSKYMTNVHREHILYLLKIFFNIKLSHESEFAANVTQYIIDYTNGQLNKMTTSLFGLVLKLHPNEEILNYAIDVIMNGGDFSDPLFDSAIQYVTFCVGIIYKHSKHENVISKIFYFVLMQNNVSNIILNSLKKMLLTVAEDASYREKYRILREDAKQVIMVRFNRTKEIENPLFFSFLLCYASIIGCDEEEENDVQWQEFQKVVVEPWINDEEYDEKFCFVINETDLFEKYNLSTLD
ncbi:hypothetical protein TRFO_19011 [Tritrichomonas foetus]|uniref:Uncharacterized protein n=1 Tax=Tritrichomonas foetus TaxID=1144522 RepID=A0A1J4KPX1_9EUKA|nr:hypothetical protein TRFO_19011 [Tritrichomonas foetus]|eukprot:OHT11477.1 hypothetical protein TRFO_19011 [Tritrichomonas foetus]